MEPYNFTSHLQFLHSFETSDDLTPTENDKLSKINILIINVKNSNERKDKICEWIDKLKLNTFIFNAVDGTQLQIHDTSFNPLVKVLEYLGQYFLLDYTRHFDHNIRGELGSGMIGDSLSHILLYHLLQFQTHFNYFLIMEDDASLIEEPAVIRKYLANLPDQFDLAFLNSESKWYPLQFTTAINDYYCNIERTYFNAPVSYIVSKQGAAKLLAYSRHDVTRPPDDLLSNPHVLNLYTVIASNKFLFGCNYSFISDTARFSNAQSSIGKNKSSGDDDDDDDDIQLSEIAITTTTTQHT